MSEQTPEQVEGVEPQVKGTEGAEAPAEEPTPAKKSSLEEVREAYPVGTRVVFEKSDDKGKAGTVTGHVEKFGVGYLEVTVELLNGKTRETTTRVTSVRQETEEDVAARQAAAEEKAKKEAEAKAKKEAEQVEAPPAEVSPSQQEQEAEEAAAEETAAPKRRRGRKTA